MKIHKLISGKIKPANSSTLFVYLRDSGGYFREVAKILIEGNISSDGNYRNVDERRMSLLN